MPIELKVGRYYKCRSGGYWKVEFEAKEGILNLRLLKAGRCNPRMVISADETTEGTARSFLSDGRHFFDRNYRIISEVIP